MKKIFNFKVLTVVMIISVMLLGTVAFADTEEYGYGHGHHRGYAEPCYEAIDEDDEASISVDEALTKVEEYLKDIDEEISISGEGVELYRHYRFNLEKDNEFYGVLSVDKYTGDIWHNHCYGNWR